MQTVSFETALKLKAAGFQQPEIETGQVWYNLNSAATLIGLLDPCEKGLRYFYCHSLASGRSQRILPATDDAFFAPTATDILRELPSISNLSKPFNAEWWICIYGENEDDLTQSKNPAEAAAAAWLAIHEKK